LADADHFFVDLFEVYNAMHTDNFRY